MLRNLNLSLWLDTMGSSELAAEASVVSPASNNSELELVHLSASWSLRSYRERKERAEVIESQQ